jgi:hypothetical protein
MSLGGSGLTGGKKVKVGGKTYPSLSSAARAHGVIPTIAHQRQTTYVWTLEQALGIKELPEESSGPKSLVISNLEEQLVFHSHREAADYFDFPCKKFMGRMANGWTCEQTLELQPREKKQRDLNVINLTVDDKTQRYHSRLTSSSSSSNPGSTRSGRAAHSEAARSRPRCSNVLALSASSRPVANRR